MLEYQSIIILLDLGAVLFYYGWYRSILRGEALPTNVALVDVIIIRAIVVLTNYASHHLKIETIVKLNCRQKYDILIPIDINKYWFNSMEKSIDR